MPNDHLLKKFSGGKESLLFPAASGGCLARTLAKAFYQGQACKQVFLIFDGTTRAMQGAVLAASTGATLTELMGRLVHSTTGEALRCQHAAKDRDVQIARALFALVEK